MIKQQSVRMLSLYERGKTEGIISLTTIQYIEEYGHEDNEEIKLKVIENLLKLKCLRKI